MTDPILCAQVWNTNADLIVACTQLGYLHDDWLTLDPTWGRGIWWKKWCPQELVRHDKYTLDGVDFRELPHDDGTFEAITYDPPYVCVGGRTTTSLPDMHDRFGLTNAPNTPQDLQLMINAGLDELWRVAAKKCRVLVKCQNYVSSGHVWPGAFETYNHARRIGFKFVDDLTHIQKGVRPQPTTRNGKTSKQQHARRNHSNLFIFQK